MINRLLILIWGIAFSIAIIKLVIIPTFGFDKLYFVLIIFGFLPLHVYKSIKTGKFFWFFNNSTNFSKKKDFHQINKGTNKNRITILMKIIFSAIFLMLFIVGIVYFLYIIISILFYF